MQKDLHASQSIINLSLALYLLSMAIAPLWWTSFGVVFGRRAVYIISFGLSIIFSIPSALTNSIYVLLVLRLFTGGCLVSVQTVGAATIADLWQPRERGLAMGVFFLGPQAGLLVGPIIGGALTGRWGWRSTIWFMVVLTAIALIIPLLLVPETSPMAPSTSGDHPGIQSPGMTAQHKKVAKMILVEPFKAFRVLRSPAIVLIMIWVGEITLSLHVLNVGLQDSFGRDPYSFDALELGLVYIPSSLGYIVGAIVGGRWMDSIMQRTAEKAQRYDESGKLVFYPEDRLKENAWIGALLAPAGFIWYGWTVENKVCWLAPVV
jgi:MFS family permease